MPVKLDTKISAQQYETPHARQDINPDEHTRFFTEMLEDIDEPTLPFGLSDMGRDGVETNEAHLKLSQTLDNQLRVHAQNLQVSVASIYHLAWAQVLAKASGRDAVVFGTVLFLDRKKCSTSLGPTINTLPMRINIDEKSVETAVRDSHARFCALSSHRHAPFVLTQRCSGVSEDLPLFTALLSYRYNEAANAIKILDVNSSSSMGQTTYPLMMSVDNDDNSVCLSVQVASPISAKRICAYMQQSLQSLSDSLTYFPQQPVRDLIVMPPDERTLLLHDWNPKIANHPPVFCLHQLFEAQVECRGQAIAVEYNGQNMSYSELNSQANQLAHYLIAQGVKPDDRIAICVVRSMKLVVAILGIMKSGGAYVPLDPVYTNQRLKDILLDTNPTLLLADAAGRNALGDHHVRTIELEKPLPTNLPIGNPDTTKLGLTSANLAYVLYTSGSTGAPKGVMVEHRQVVHLFETERDKFDFNENDKCCMFHSISFGVSFWEIWNALLHGCSLSIVSKAMIHSTHEFFDWICANGINVLCQTPSAFKILMRVKMCSSHIDRLRYVIVAGEVLNPVIAKEWYEKCGKSGTMLVNMWGSTETTIHSTFQQIQSAEDIYTIGRPLPGLRVYLLDSYGEPVLLGAEGEMYIGGATVTRGYLNRSELTSERFLFDRFNKDPSARMYRTGDLARYLPNGNLMFLGRADQQVKIRGFRIEPGEIEARLVEYPGVCEAVVQSYGDGTDARLVAYVVANPDNSLAQNLRTYLLTLLPDYMVPAAYVCLPSLPLTPSGKLNRRALPAPDDEAFARQRYEAPQGEIEEKLADLWRELLTNIDRISRHDSFFELGGHSLLVTTLVNKAKLYDIHIENRDVYSFPVLEKLAEKVASHSKRVYSDVAIPVRQSGNDTPLFLLPDGGGDISYAFEIAHDIDKNIPVYVLPWSSPEAKLPSSIEEMASTMIPLIKTIQPNGPYKFAGYCSGGILAFEIAKQLLNSGDAVSFLGFIDTPAPSAPIVNLSETELFIAFLLWTYPNFGAKNDSMWWDRIGELALDEAVEEIREINLNLNDPIDIEWEVLLTKQRYNYQRICDAYKYDSIPVAIHLFKAIELCLDYFHNRDLDNSKKHINYPKIGWENYNLSPEFNVVPVDGNHNTILTDPKNRVLLGKKLTKIIQRGK